MTPNTLKEWVEENETRLKPLDLDFMHRQMSVLLESEERIERFAFDHPLAVVLVKLADYHVKLALVDTQNPDILQAISGRLDAWYEAYGIVAYSLKQAYDKQSVLVAPIDGTLHTPTDDPIPEWEDHWDVKVPLSMSQLQVEVIEVHK